jgi:hypothetical protein
MCGEGMLQIRQRKGRRVNTSVTQRPLSWLAMPSASLLVILCAVALRKNEQQPMTRSLRRRSRGGGCWCKRIRAAEAHACVHAHHLSSSSSFRLLLRLPFPVLGWLVCCAASASRPQRSRQRRRGTERTEVRSRSEGGTHVSPVHCCVPTPLCCLRLRLSCPLVGLLFAFCFFLPKPEGKNHHTQRSAAQHDPSAQDTRTHTRIRCPSSPLACTCRCPDAMSERVRHAASLPPPTPRRSEAAAGRTEPGALDPHANALSLPCASVLCSG